MISFDDQILILSIDGQARETGTTKEVDSAHSAAMMNDPVDERQRVCFGEAALIRYFQPEYNTIFKKTFPSPAHDSYSQCYDVDLNAVSVELSFESFPFSIFSQAVVRSRRHFAQFPLHSPELRKSMFDVVL